MKTASSKNFYVDNQVTGVPKKINVICHTHTHAHAHAHTHVAIMNEVTEWIQICKYMHCRINRHTVIIRFKGLVYCMNK